MQQNFANFGFYILQGSAATHLRCGGQCGMVLLQIFGG